MVFSVHEYLNDCPINLACTHTSAVSVFNALPDSRNGYMTNSTMKQSSSNQLHGSVLKPQHPADPAPNEKNLALFFESNPVSDDFTIGDQGHLRKGRISNNAKIKKIDPLQILRRTN